MQPLPFFFNKQTIQQDISRIRRPRQHTSASGPQFNFYKPDFRKSEFRKAGKPRIALRICCAKITARRNRFECASE
jgi:hypothetical protein